MRIDHSAHLIHDSLLVPNHVQWALVQGADQSVLGRFDF
jgi:hypothetical protein